MQLLKTFSQKYKSLKNIFRTKSFKNRNFHPQPQYKRCYKKECVSYSSNNSIRSYVKKDTKSTASYGKIIQKHTVFLTTKISKL